MFAVINVSTATTTTLVSATPGKKIRVMNYVFVTGGTVNPYFKSSGGVALTGPFPLAVQAGIASGPAPEVYQLSQGHFETGTGESLQLVTDTSAQVSGHLSYIVVN